MTAAPAPASAVGPGGPFSRRLAWIGALSFASGFPYFFFNETVPVFLAARGVSLADIGLATGASLPWALKFLWAPLVDRLGSRAAWIRSCLALLGAAMLAFATLPLGGATALAVLLVTYVALSATQDIAIDAYTIETTTAPELGVANSVRIGAYRGASFISSALLLWIAARAGWAASFGAGGAIFLLLAVAALALPSTRRRSTVGDPSIGAPIAALFRRPGIWAVLLFTLLFKLDISALEPMTKPFWVQRGFTLAEISTLTTGRLLATLAGAAIGGVLATRAGIFRALWSLGAVQLLSSLAYAGAAAGTSRPLIVGAALFENLAAGLGTAAFLAFLMSMCERRHAATQFALLSAVYALSRWGAGLASGVLAERMGFAPYFLLTFCAGLPAYLLLPRLRHARAPDAET